MKNYMKVMHDTQIIELSRKFAKLAENPYCMEFKQLLEIHKHFPTYTITVKEKREFTGRETYRGLTYDYMESYISTHENAEETMLEYNQLRLMSQCYPQGTGYFTIKQWFLKQYPEVAALGVI